MKRKTYVWLNLNNHEDNWENLINDENIPAEKSDSGVI